MVEIIIIIIIRATLFRDVISVVKHDGREDEIKKNKTKGPFYTELAPATSMLQYGNTDVCFFKYYYYTDVELRKCCCTSDLTKSNIIRRH